VPAMQTFLIVLLIWITSSFRWLAPLDVAASSGRALPSSVAMQPRADGPAQNIHDPFSRSLKVQQKGRTKPVPFSAISASPRMA
jgi:hypothetical protein